MPRCRVHRLLVLTLDVEPGDINPGSTAEDTAREIAKDIPEADWLVIDEWVE